MNEQESAIKLRGVPFDQDQIINALRQHPDVHQANVKLVNDNNGRRLLVAFTTLKTNYAATVSDLRDFARSKLYPQLVPDFFIIHTEGQPSNNTRININLTEQGFRPPRDATDILLLNIYTDLLERIVGIDNDFFAEGGHSLLAVDLLSRIEKATGQSLPLSIMLTRSTVRALADALVHGLAPAAEGDIVELQQGSGGQPLFFLHGDYTGGGFFSRDIAHNANLDGSFLIVQPYGLGRTQGLELPDSIEEMAAAHVEMIRQRQPEGPYRLAGHCNGSIIAFEIAQQLRRSGETIEFLCMIDPLSAHRISDERLPPAIDNNGTDQAKTLGSDSEPLDEESYRKRLRNHYMRIGAAYQASVYDGPVSVILLSQRRMNRDQKSGWAQVLKNRVIQRIETRTPDHLAAIQQNAGTVGKMLSTALAGIQPSS